MKILYYFQELNTPMFQWQRKHFLDELPRHGVEFESFNPLLYTSTDEANSILLDHIKNNHYDLFVSNLGYYRMLCVEALESIKTMGLPTLRIAWDNLMIPYIDEVLAPHFDLVWLTAKETERLYKKWGVNYFFAPYAANPYTFTYRPTELKRSACFIGNPHGSRAIMINTLTNKGLPVSLYCGGKSSIATVNDTNNKRGIINPSVLETIINRFRFKEGRRLMCGSIVNKFKKNTVVSINDFLTRQNGLSHDDMVKTYSSFVLSLSSTSAGHTDVLKNPLPIINLRNFEIPMSGGIEICKYNEELASYFEDGKEIVLYATEEELVDKARYYIEKASETEILKMKLAARKRAVSDHTWYSRFKKAFDILGLKTDD